MLRNNNFWKYSCVVVFAFLFQWNCTAQNKSFSLTDDDVHKDDIVMTWKKDTPEQEMKDDIKALAEKGITIKYSDVKRNSDKEITAIHVEYSDRKGNKGQLEYNNQKPIGTIKFYKNGDEIGFGSPSGSYDGLASNDLFQNNFAGAQDILKQFNLGKGNPNSQSFSFSFPNDGESMMRSKSKIMIQKDGKKPLVIEDGEVTEGGDDYTKEELDEIKKSNRIEQFGGNGNNEFDIRSKEGLDNFRKQMERMQSDTPRMDKDDFNQTKEEMLKAKEEMIKAREELEKAKKELEKPKTKSALKTQKA